MRDHSSYVCEGNFNGRTLRGQIFAIVSDS